MISNQTQCSPACPFIPLPPPALLPRWRVLFTAALFLLIMFGPVRATLGYSLLTHEEIIDMMWKDELKPLLTNRFPDVTEKDLQKAHAFAYGGCLVQDMGYYPLGNKYFSDLTHYVRSGDFVSNLVRESTNLNEYAFALGALAHYCADNSGHPSINRAVALSFPKLRRKFGDSVTYADDPKAHIRVEFGFDMTQVAKNRYSSDQYHDFIGFEVSKPVLQRAFIKTYDLPLADVLRPVDLSIGTFRHAVSQFIPQLTRVALHVQRAEIVKTQPTFNERRFLYLLSRSEYEKEWGKDYRKPSFGARVLALILKWVPKIGPMKALAFKVPSSETEELYIKSVNNTVTAYRDSLRGVKTGHVVFPNLDFDTGKKPQVGEYKLSDQTYARLLDMLSKKGRVNPELRQNILAYYAAGPAPDLSTRKARRAWQKTQSELVLLKETPARLVPTGPVADQKSKVHQDPEARPGAVYHSSLKSPKNAAQ